MKKIYNKILPLLAGVALTGAFTACSDDDAPTGADTSKPFVCEAVNVEEGTEVSPELDVITLQYSHPVAVNVASPITLNGEAQTSTYKDNTVSVQVSLQPGRSYALFVPANCVAHINGARFADAMTINFRTAGGTVVDPSAILPLINTNATAQTKNVYNFLVQQNGKKVLSGAMANVNNNNDFAGWIKTVTGKDVAITGYDFIHLPESGQNWIDYSDITPAKSQWEANGLVSYMWHWRVPTDKAAYDAKDVNKYDSSIKGEHGGSGTEFDIREALKEGTWQNECIMADIDKVAGYLKLLQDANIPVLWRPLHEAAGSYKYDGAWFWWGRYGDEYTKKLWDLLYDRLVNHHGLNNLIWVWTAQYEQGFEAQMTASYPGNDKVDIVGVDIYADDDNAQKAAYDALAAMTQGKRIVTISETGRIQNPDKCFAEGAAWSWFSLWYTYNQHTSGNTTDGFGNTAESIKAVLESPFVINRGDMPSLK